MNRSDKTRWTRAARGRIPAPMAGVRILVNTAPDVRTASGQPARPEWSLTRTVYFRDVQQRESAPIIVGRDRTCDLVIRHATVSARHCRIEPDAAHGYALEDCGSSNGVYLATHGPDDIPRRIEWEPLTLGCYVYLGDVALVPIDDHGQARIAAARMGDYLRHARAVYGSDTQVGQHLGLSGTLLQRVSRLWNGLTRTQHHPRERERSSA